VLQSLACVRDTQARGLTLPQLANWLKVDTLQLSPVMEALLLTRQGPDLIDTRSLFETDLPYLKGAEPASRFEF